MKRTRWRYRQMALVIGVMLAGLAGVAHGSVKYSATYDAGADSWEYQYFVTNDYSLTEAITTFTIDFLPAPNYTVVSQTVPLGWYLDPGLLPSFVTAVDTSAGIAPGETLGGFLAAFTYSGDPGGVPADQTFIGNLSGGGDFSGITTTVPEPGSYLLALLALATVRRKGMWFD